MARLIFLVSLVWAVVAPSIAMAQEYGPSLGDLRDVPTIVRAGEWVALRGTGFAASSDVEISLMANDLGDTAVLGGVVVDDEGTLETSVPLSDDVEPGAYTISASGDTVDGGVRVLSTALQVVPEDTDTTVAGSGSDTTVAGSGSDTTVAGSGSDTTVAGSGSDTTVAGSGSDTTVAG
ncbi:MAG: hypothetical protein U9R47_07335, partial [Actinomycetota bacterium]|nr:hypothetical protein [Actinomycetota bacterium]